MCLIRFIDSGGAIRIHESRLYADKAAAMEKLPKKGIKRSIRADLGPWAYWH